MTDLPPPPPPPAPQGPPPGWYPNPEGGGQRYWDGARWTEHVADESGSRSWPRIVLLAGIAALLIGGGIATAYILSGGEEETCVSETTGESTSCDSSSAVSEEEFAKAEAEEKAAQQEAETCEEQLGQLLKEIQEMDSRLAVGLAYAEYGRQVGNIRVAYDVVPFRKLGLACVGDVGKPLEDAMNSYSSAGDRWNDCITDFSCKQDSIDPLLQADWLDASSDLRRAQSGLRDMARP